MEDSSLTSILQSLSFSDDLLNLLMVELPLLLLPSRDLDILFCSLLSPSSSPSSMLLTLLMVMIFQKPFCLRQLSTCILSLSFFSSATNFLRLTCSSLKSAMVLLWFLLYFISRLSSTGWLFFIRERRCNRSDFAICLHYYRREQSLCQDRCTGGAWRRVDSIRWLGIQQQNCTNRRGVL